MKRGRRRYTELDNLFRQVILAKYGNRCIRCNSGKHVQVSHIIPKKLEYRSLRWHPDNAIPLCRRCHLYWWHRDPLGVIDWLIENGFDLDRLRRLRVLASSDYDHEATKMFLTQYLKNLERSK